MPRRRHQPPRPSRSEASRRTASLRPDALRPPATGSPVARPDDLRTIEPDVDGGLPLGAERIERRRIGGRRLVVKRSGRRPRADLRREATVLGALQGDEVIEFVEHIESDDGDELHTIDAGSSSLADPWTGSSSQRSTTFAAACAALANLHARGWFHGAVALDHIVVADDGTVRWCSLSSAGRTDADPSGVDLDRVALMRAAHRVARTLPRAQLLRRQLARLGDRPDPRRLARVFRRWSRHRQRTAGLTRPTAVSAVAALIVAAGSTTVALRGCVDTAPNPDDGAASSLPASSTPSATASGTQSATPPPARPEVVLDGSRRVVGRADDVPFVVDRDCDGRDDLVVLRPSTGEVFDFPFTPNATSTPGRRILRVAGARSFEPQSSCGPPGLRRDDGSVIPVLSP